MRRLSNTALYDTWSSGGPFIGIDNSTASVTAAGVNAAPHGRVTVEKNWRLRKSTLKNFYQAGKTGKTYHRGPIRWFQRSDNSQAETEIPNIFTIDIDRSVDNDASTCKIVMFNQKMLQNADPGPIGTAGRSVGQPGFYTFDRGDSVKSYNKWGWEQNFWNDVLTPDALIRTYQGYGGNGKSIDNAVADGNILLTGTWLVDEVQIDAASGTLTLSCRDMTKLLIEQEIYPPLVPTTGDVHYPLYYYRWTFHDHPVIAYGTPVYYTNYTGVEPSTVNVTLASTSELAVDLDGHVKSDAIDGQDVDTYWLSNGQASASGPDDYVWWECNFNTPTPLNGFTAQLFGGGYTLYVSVYADGAWQDDGNPAHIIPYVGALDTGTYKVDIPYVRVFPTGWEFPVEQFIGGNLLNDFDIPYYNADKIRLTFTRLVKTAVGPNHYRAGIRDFTVGSFADKVSAYNTKIAHGIQRGRGDEDRGYWICGSDGGVFTFGNLRFYGSRGAKHNNADTVGMAADDLNGGYRLVGADGGVFVFGDLSYKGSLPGDGITSTIVTDIANGDNWTDADPIGSKGYYILEANGNIHAYGNATHHGNASLASFAVRMAVRNGGYWVVDAAGHVQAFGSASNHGDAAISYPTHHAVGIEATPSGNGYWIAAEDGAVYAKGDAVYYGGANNGAPGGLPHLNGPIIDMATNWNGKGYWLLGEDGGVFTYGAGLNGLSGDPLDAPKWWGSLPLAYQRIGEGNYQDYTDIVRDLLLWNGWWYYTPSLDESSPAEVFGNLELTGIYSPENLTEDFFDKKPSIDIINTLKEIVGYIAYSDETGAFHFETPNIWKIGNFWEDGTKALGVMPVVDESKQITAYTLGISDRDARSQITIASSDPQVHLPDTKSVTIQSQWADRMLNGIVRPALWVNGQFVDKNVMTKMAKLIDLHTFMASRQGNLTMPACPVLQIDDQIRIYERVTSETYIHYLRGYTSSMDLEKGSYTMTLQTHWMGDGTSDDAWFLRYDTHVAPVQRAFVVDKDTLELLAGWDSAKVSAITLGVTFSTEETTLPLNPGTIQRSLLFDRSGSEYDVYVSQFDGSNETPVTGPR